MSWNTSKAESTDLPQALSQSIEILTPPTLLVLVSCLFSCLLNSLLSYFLARPYEIPLLKNGLVRKEDPSGAMLPSPNGRPSMDASAVEGASTLRPQESAIVSGEQLHFPSAPLPHPSTEDMVGQGTSQGVGTAVGFYRDSATAVFSPVQRPAGTGPPIGVSPTLVDNLPSFVSVLHAKDTLRDTLGADEEELAMLLPPPSIRPHGTTDEEDEEAARQMEAEAAARARTTYAELRIEAQYVVFDTNRMFLLVSVLKSLTMIVVIHYHMDTPGGWNRFLVCCEMLLMSGLSTPMLELVCALLLPSDREVEEQEEKRRLAELERSAFGDDPSSEVDTVLIVQLMLQLSNLEFHDLTTVFIQGSVFVLTGLILVPPLTAFCSWSFAAYCWFYIPLGFVILRVRRWYYNQQRSTDTDPTKVMDVHSFRWILAKEIFKCVVIKVVIMWMLIFLLQSTYLLARGLLLGLDYETCFWAMAAIEGRSLVDYIQTLQEESIEKKSWFWLISLCSQLLF